MQMGKRLCRWGVAVAAVAWVGCAGEGAGGAGEELGSSFDPMMCEDSEPTDMLVLDLVKHAWLAGFPLTRLQVDAEGLVTGTDVPDSVAGDLEVINHVPEARAALARAVSQFAGLPNYEVGGIGPDEPACEGVPAWSPSGTVYVSTTANLVTPKGESADSWQVVHAALAKEAPLLAVPGRSDMIDPPGDGSTCVPTSVVGGFGVKANAFGLCDDSIADEGTWCMLNYASYRYFSGERVCTEWYGNLRCMLR